MLWILVNFAFAFFSSVIVFKNNLFLLTYLDYLRERESKLLRHLDRPVPLSYWFTFQMSTAAVGEPSKNQKLESQSTLPKYMKGGSNYSRCDLVSPRVSDSKIGNQYGSRDSNLDTFTRDTVSLSGILNANPNKIPTLDETFYGDFS